MSKGRPRVSVFLAGGLISYHLDPGFLKAKGKGGKPGMSVKEAERKGAFQVSVLALRFSS